MQILNGKKTQNPNTCQPKNSFPELKLWQSFAVLVSPAQGRTIWWLEQEVYRNELLLSSAKDSAISVNHVNLQ